MDLTGKTDAQGMLYMLLGIVDHGSRAALCLQALPRGFDNDVVNQTRIYNDL